MPDLVNVRLPNGAIVNNVPEDMSASLLLRTLARNGAISFQDEVDFLRTMAPTGGAAPEGLREQMLAGAGKALTDIRLGGQQVAGDSLAQPPQLPVEGAPLMPSMPELLRREAAAKRGLDRELMQTGGGLAGAIGGGVAAGLPLALVPGANTYAGSALGGALYGALQPTSEAGERKRNAAVGAVGGAVGKVAGNVARRVLAPTVDEPVRTMIDARVPLTPGQILGGSFKTAEDKLTSLPVTGDFIQSARTRGVEAFNRAAINKATAPIGKKITAIGHEGIEQARDAIGAAYDDLLPKMVVKADKIFSRGAGKLQSMVQSLNPDAARKFNAVFAEHITGKLGNAGAMSGEVFKRVDSELGRLARGLRGSAVFAERDLGDAFLQLQNLLRKASVRSNPTLAPQLRGVNQAYAQLLRVENAAARSGAQEGVFRPAHLRQAARQLDSSLRKRSFAQGKALGQSFAEAGQAVLPSTIPDSGTFGRAAMGGLAVGASAVNPMVPIGLAAGGALYTPPAQWAMQQLLTNRPAAVRGLGLLANQLSPAFGTGGSAALTNYPNQGLLGQ